MSIHLNKNQIEGLNRVEKLKLINSVSGIKPANLIGSIDSKGNTNVAVFSSVVHLGSNPPLLGFIMRPTGDVPRHTYSNIMETEYYTINHIHSDFTKKAHYTSAKFDKEVSEFTRCGLTEEYIDNFKVPFVKESNFKMVLRYREQIDIALNNTVMIIGEIEHIILPENTLKEDSYLNLEDIDSVGISGLNSYYKVSKIADYPYARVKETPNFQ